MPADCGASTAVLLIEYSYMQHSMYTLAVQLAMHAAHLQAGGAHHITFELGSAHGSVGATCSRQHGASCCCLRFTISIEAPPPANYS